MSGPRWVTEARRALTNRSATAYIGIVPDPAQVPYGGRVALLRPNIVIVHQPPGDDDSLLVAVIRLMRAQAITAADSAGRLGDTGVAAAKLRDAAAGLGEIEQITKKAAAIRNSAAAIDDLASTLRARVDTAIGQALEHLRAEP